ncbi:MAG: 50S ribosomal protein L13 [Alphaproteobacteria bacterium TMED87]|nr:50S ribosomal protein L13 [Rhodospirillaceae bacterium]OUV09708.1 MAG: 50S ribosomal protein L13 [Alphaproteobacteria bacterium TMED87]
MKTFSAKPADVKRKWFLLDAEGLVLGRLAAKIATILRGKHKTIYTPHIDTGDNVVVVNASKVHLTGSKFDKKNYYWHTGYPGGIKSRSVRQVLEGSFPERVLQMAVQRMMPKGPLGRDQLKKLKVYSGPEHPHQAQSPELLDFAVLNKKNRRKS